MKPNKAQKKEQMALEKISKENLALHETLKRRTKELEQKNRELQIEAALEKVRARTMAMQHSDELQEVINSVYNRLIELDIEIHACTIITPAKNPKELLGWFASSTQEYLEPLHMPNHGNVIIKDAWNGFKNTRELFSKTYSFKEKNKLFSYLFEHSDFFKNTKADRKQMVLESKAYSISNTFNRYSGIQLNRYSDKQFSKQENEILIRFGKVFEQTYTRFLDLQKAERQARAAEIELALERVRARTMAMQHSDELQEASFLLDQQVRALGIKTWGCAFNIYEEKESTEWFSGAKGIVPPYKTPRENFFKHYYDLGQKGETFYKEEYADEACVALYEYLCTLPEAGKAARKIKEEGGSFPTRQIAHVAYFKQGYLLFITLEDVPEAHDIFKRFAKVFEQTYTRFLDLQKAEEQAREAEIELALERVRARTMAMQHSNELAETASLLFQQVSKLGVELWGCSFNIWEPGDTSFTSWWGGRDLVLKDSWYIPLTEHAIFMLFDASRKRGDKLWVEEAGDEKLATRYQYMLGLPDVGAHLQGLLKAGITFPTFQIDHIVNFSHGNVLFITYEPCPEAYDIFKRFAKVFEQTYTRFLDLQKAEAQAREATIETALEKVRSRTMGMQNSEELKDTALLLFQQVDELGIKSYACGFNIWDDDKKAATAWMASKDHLSLPFKTNSAEDVYLPIYEAEQRGESLLIIEQGGKELEEHYKYLVTIPEVKEMSEAGLSFPTFQIIHCAYFSQGYLMFITYESVPEAYDIFKRFAKVFEQTYTRFFDLQKAEEQAREAGIENALEKVRSRSLAMHKSDELQEVINTIYDRLIELDIRIDAVNFTIFSEGSKDFTLWTGVGGKFYRHPQHLPYIDFGLTKDMWVAIEDGQSFFSKQYSFENKNRWWSKAFEVSDLKHVPKDRKKLILKAEGYTVTMAIEKFSCLQLNRYSNELFSEKDRNVTKRFAKVFEQAYIRFLDLQKAEAQTRESQIEAALEKVRSRSLAMQHSDELQEVINSIYNRLAELKIEINSCTIISPSKNPKELLYWFASSAQKYVKPFHIPNHDNSIIEEMWNGFKNTRELFSKTYLFKEKNKFFNYVFEHTDFKNIPEDRKQLVLESKAYTISNTFNRYSGIQLLRYSDKHFSKQENEILVRFGKVFEQTYIRFLDLQKAEDQAREAQIEAALEKVRSRSLAMRQSQELLDVITEIFLQLEVLEIPLDSCFINIYRDETPKDMTAYIAAGGRTYRDAAFLPFIKSPMFTKLLESRKNNESFYSIKMDKKDTVRWWKHFFSNATNIKVPRKRNNYIAKSPGLATSVSVGKYASLHMMRYVPTPYSDEENQIFMRFGKVFDQVYTRFLDLQKAEAQAREAQIEASLERVRSQAMAMRQSDDLVNCTSVVFDELEKLNLSIERSGIGIFDPETKDCKLWSIVIAEDGTKELATGVTSLTIHPMLIKTFDSWGTQKSFTYVLEGKELEHYYKLVANSEFILSEEVIGKSTSLPKEYYHYSPFAAGGLYFFSDSEPVDEDKLIIRRFAEVFDLTYTRYEDLQKAEEQAREAQIEAALERVRSRTMGMQKSEELANVIKVIYEQLIDLNINIDFSGFAMDYRESNDWNLWVADSILEYPVHIHIPYLNHTQFNREIEARDDGLDFQVCNLTFEEKNKMWDHVFKYMPASQEAKEVLYNCAGHATSWVLLKNITLFSCNIAGIPFTDAENATIKRFGNVFEQTYTRFNDLKQAEEQALEAVKRTSIDRVRAEIASMRTAKDLEQITPLIWKELTILNIPFIRCGVFIMDESEQVIDNYLSTPDGEAIAVFQLPYKTPGAIADILKHWQQRKTFLDHWDEDAMEEFAKVLVDQRIFKSSDQYLKALPKEGFYLHFLPFNQGMLYVGNTTQLKDNEVQIIQSLANAFSTAYARYEDFNKLEAAKQLADNALVDLKQTQQQLVQSEKMASLGELTAGIAHEIQNPLNFVNNFSEVSKELLEEMLEEMANGDLEEVKTIADDLIQNLEKITHHGKRADGIVKGMLQHSRASGDKKEPTDINTLADEYLRLAYHGLRAKDKSFNATMKTDYDTSIKTIEIIPQDMGRVILNLLTNAFYVVNEKKKENVEGYEPTVSISTKKKKDLVEIKVMDNGNGIPKKVVDKIFQPFFTTKPTGEGTGLGLSMSYDIITKGHGGELKVKTNKGRGTTFTIIIPENKK